MRIWSFLFFYVLLQSQCYGQSISPVKGSELAGAARLDLHIGGRVSQQTGGSHGVKLVHEWPGVYFEAAFSGDAVLAAFDDDLNEYRLVIDDLPPITINQPKRSVLKISAVGEKSHKIRLEKVTESIGSARAFDGFYVAPGETALTPEARRRQIEFIGDSSMTGYGDRSTKRECTPEEVRATTDSQQDYTALTAKHYDADYQINAISGVGLLRNYAGQGQALASAYFRVLPSSDGVYSDPQWQPQIIVTKIDADFATPLTPDEKWKSDAALADDYAQSYAAFIASIHRKSPSSSFILWWPTVAPDANTPYASAMRNAEEVIGTAARAQGIRVDFLHYGDLKLEGTACHNHASLADHRKVERILIDYIDAHSDLWHGQ